MLCYVFRAGTTSPVPRGSFWRAYHPFSYYWRICYWWWVSPIYGSKWVANTPVVNPATCIHCFLFLFLFLGWARRVPCRACHSERRITITIIIRTGATPDPHHTHTHSHTHTHTLIHTHTHTHTHIYPQYTFTTFCDFFFSGWARRVPRRAGHSERPRLRKTALLLKAARRAGKT